MRIRTSRIAPTLVPVLASVLWGLVWSPRTASAAQDDPRAAIVGIVTAVPAEGWIEFDPLIELDWEAAARESITEINLDAPSPAALRRVGKYEWGSLVIDFALEIPTALRQRNYYLVSPDGVTELEIREITGIARFVFDANAEAISSTRYYGYARAAPVEALVDFNGGFVIHAEGPITLSVERAALSAEDLARAQTKKSAPEAYFAQGTEFWNIVNQTAIRLGPDGRVYLLVRWAPDQEGHDGFCQFRFSLFELGVEIQLLNTLSRGCDI